MDLIETEREGHTRETKIEGSEAGLRLMRTTACSHGWHGIKVTEDGGMLEVDGGGCLRGWGR
jgi:hypothetical protein